ncbi:MAG: AI-2E family transporter, partial [Polyangiaceae bacterium]
MRTNRTPESPREEASWERKVLTTLAMIAALAFLVLAFKILLVLFAGLLGALVLSSAARKVSSWTRLPHAASVAVLVVLGFAFTVGLAVALAPPLTKQVDTLMRDLPGIGHRVEDALRRTPIAGPAVQKSIDEPQPGSTKEVVGAAVSTLGSTMEVLGGLIVIFFVAVYGAAQPELYRDTALALTPPSMRGRMRRVLGAASQNLTRWLLGRLVAMTFVAVTTSIAFFLLKVPLALLFGMLAGLLTFIEYAGAVVSAIPPLIFAFSKSPATALAVFVVYCVLHIIEGYLL